jgi:hypothetical protein
MLLTNVTRSALYEALPNHRPFPAKSGLTSRFPLRNRLLWEEAAETAAIYFGKAKCARGETKAGMLRVDRVGDRRC